MMLWIELNREFERMCEQENPPLEALKRMIGYSNWCLDHGADDVRTAAALAFCEHHLDTDARARLLPRLMSRAEFLELRELLQYHNAPEAIDQWLTTLWSA